MTQRIYKWGVPVKDDFTIELPEDARVLTVQTQGGIGGAPQMWVLCDPNAKKERRRFRVFGTGHPVESDDDLEYVGTFQLEDGALVFHLFEAMTTLAATPVVT